MRNKDCNGEISTKNISNDTKGIIRIFLCRYSPKSHIFKIKCCTFPDWRERLSRNQTNWSRRHVATSLFLSHNHIDTPPSIWISSSFLKTFSFRCKKVSYNFLLSALRQKSPILCSDRFVLCFDDAACASPSFYICYFFEITKPN